MHNSRVRSRLKAQLTKFTLQLTEGLSCPSQKSVSQILFGIQASQDVKLSNIARSLEDRADQDGESALAWFNWLGSVGRKAERLWMSGGLNVSFRQACVT